MADIKVGQELRGALIVYDGEKNSVTVITYTAGRINNVTDFGAFVDIGVGKDALLHTSCMKGKKDSLSVTNQIFVKVISVNIALQRISLELID